MLIAYADESGKHQGAKALVVAGFISSATRWSHFKKEWARALSRANIRGRFHMTDFLRGVEPPYNEWTYAAKSRFVGELTRIVRAHIIGGAAVVLPFEPYRRLVEPTTSIARKHLAFKEPFIMCGEAFLRNAAIVAGRDGTEIDAIFDQNHEVDFEFAAHMRWVREVELDRFYRSVSFASSAAESPLQAADILAYETARKYSEEVLGLARSGVGPYFTELWEHRTISVWHYPEDELRRAHGIVQAEKVAAATDPALCARLTLLNKRARKATQRGWVPQRRRQSPGSGGDDSR